MTSHNEDGSLDRAVLRDEATPDVEGHIRPAHTVHTTGPAEALPGVSKEDLDDDGPDVEGHIILR